MFDQLIDHLISGAEYPLRSSSHISKQRSQKAACRKSDRIKCKKGRNPKSRCEVRDRLPIAQERENRTRHDHSKQRQPLVEGSSNSAAPTSSNPPQTMLKPSRKAPAREVGLYRPSPYNINDAGNDEYYSQSSREDRRSKRGEFRNHRCTCLCMRQLPAFIYGEYGFFPNSVNQLTAIR
jgi:hypothetical protein